MTVAALLGCVGCAAEQDGRGRGADAAHGSGVPEVDDDKDMPPLPFDRYEFSSRDFAREEQAAARLTQRCMRSHGFPDFPRQWHEQRLEPLAVTQHAVVTMTTLYGSLDLEGARKRGYGLDRDAFDRFHKAHAPKGRLVTQKEHAALNGFGGRGTPEGGCEQDGSRRVQADVRNETRMSTYVGDRGAAVAEAVAEDARMRHALDTWADCLADKGFKRYASPEAASRDKAWGRGDDGDTRRTRRERDTAVADIECKREHNTAGVWWSVTAQLQRRDIDRHRPAYEAVRADQERVRATVRDVLEGER
ncbi:hypothetical protein GPA10_00095 [Streptomyces sp. p1417]|uniref:Uncharacterized protein n=1 Tax=Streptomyces typhae TaxID=2681492 RepID=A0A6L6WNB1_9ACTN|nr:hypothetical protein [Streptomyces typhae]MVO83199.1 hypothetical protein [Streptomyces typhae]